MQILNTENNEILILNKWNTMHDFCSDLQFGATEFAD